MILAGNYGEAGAIDLYGAGLPEAVSGQLSFWFWKPAHLPATALLTVGYQPADLRFLCGTLTRLGAVVIPYSVANQEQGTPILLCTGLRETLDHAWPELRHFD